MLCKHILGGFKGDGATRPELQLLSTTFQVLVDQQFDVMYIKTYLHRQRFGSTRDHAAPRWKRFSLELEACAHTCNAAVSVIVNHHRAGTEPSALELDTARLKLREARWEGSPTRLGLVDLEDLEISDRNRGIEVCC